MIRPWNTGHLAAQLLALAVEWMHWVLGLVTFEFLVFMISKRTECLLPSGQRSFTAPCSTIYAGVAFAGVQIVFNFMAALAITLVVQLENGVKWWEKFYSRMAYSDNVTVTDENLI